MSYFLLFATLVIAVISWFAIFKYWTVVNYFTRPGVMLVLLAWLLTASTTRGVSLTGPLGMFALGLVLFMIGDIMLILSPIRGSFLAGIAFYILAQTAYIIGLNPQPPLANIPNLILALLVIITGWQISRRILVELRAKEQKALLPYILVYILVISTLLFSGLCKLTEGESWADAHSYLVSGGVFLLFLSNIFLSFDTWVGPLPNGVLRTTMTNHLGNILLVLGASFHLLQ